MNILVNCTIIVLLKVKGLGIGKLEQNNVIPFDANT